MDKKLWTRDEEIIVFNLYCQIPFQSSSKNHPEVIRIANIIGRSPSAVNMKIGNFGSFDENLKARGIVGLTNASKLDAQIWEEFNNRWDELAFESEKLLAKFQKSGKLEEVKNIPAGKEKIATVRQRVNQNFFRRAVLASYKNSCCITGLNNPELLIASHIKSWAASNENEKTNPRNGLCLNALHDRAFDRGFITVTPKFEIIVSADITDICDGAAVEKFFRCYNKSKIILPEKFVPAEEFLTYHNEFIFENWR